MVSKSIIEKLREIYQSLPKVELVDKGDGWVNQYDFLRAVGKVGINYKSLGYDYFYEFLQILDCFHSGQISREKNLQGM